MKLLSVITVTIEDPVGVHSTGASIVDFINSGFPSVEVEWVVKDGGSSEKTLSELESIVQAVGEYCSVKLESGPDGGIYDAMNRAGKGVSSAFVIYLNGGDRFVSHESLGEEVYKSIQRHTSCDLLFFGCKKVVGERLRSGRRPAVVMYPKNTDYIKHSLPTSHQAIMFNSRLDISSLYNVKYSICGDYECVSRLYMNGASVRAVNIILSEFDIGGTSTVNTMRLCVEAFRIQREVLKNSLFLCSSSFLYRLIKLNAIKVVHRAL